LAGLIKTKCSNENVHHVFVAQRAPSCNIKTVLLIDFTFC